MLSRASLPACTLARQLKSLHPFISPYAVFSLFSVSVLPHLSRALEQSVWCWYRLIEPSPGAADDLAVAASEKDHIDTTTPASDAIDYGRLNDLLDFITQKLTTNVYGNFYISGRHAPSDARQHQLKEVIELKSLLEANKALMERKAGNATGDTAVEGKRGGKFTSAQLAAIRTVVQQEHHGYSNSPQSRSRALEDWVAIVEAQLKELKAANEALKAENRAVQDKGLIKSDTADDEVRSRLDCFEIQVEKYDRRQRSLSRDLSRRAGQVEWQSVELEQRLEKLEVAVANTEENSALTPKLEENAKAIISIKRVTTNRHEQVQEQITGLNSTIETFQESLRRATARERAIAEQANGWLNCLAASGTGPNVECSKLLQGIATNFIALKRGMGKLEDRMSEAEGWNELHRVARASFNENVENLEESANSYARDQVAGVDEKLEQVKLHLAATDTRVAELFKWMQRTMNR